MSTSDDNDAAYSDDLAIDDTAPSAMEWAATNAPSSDNSAPTTTPESTAADSDDTANDECAIWGQPSIYFPIGDHVNVSWCCSHTNASGVISTSHIVASHITKLLLSFRQILQFRF